MVALLVCGAATCAGSLIPPLTEAQAAEARKLIGRFKTNPKGPFQRIRWFCKDGSIHPPSPSPCKERGGGIQHAELSPESTRLAQWNIDTGTILTAMGWEEWFDAARDHHRLKQLVLEQYLVDVDDGWIYRGARTYRGARQAEDEEKAGRDFLQRMLSDPDWVARRYFLAAQVVSATPHGAATSVVKRVRTLSAAIADKDPRFQKLRAKIHSAPGPEDLPAVEQFAAASQAVPEVQALLTKLAEAMRQAAQEQNLPSRIAVARRLGGPELESALSRYSAEAGSRSFAAAARLSFELGRLIVSTRDGKRNLGLMDLQQALLEDAFRRYQPLRDATRGDRLLDLLDLFREAAASGLLSSREFAALEDEVRRLLDARELQPEDYWQGVRYLSRAAEWCRAAADREFGPVARFYEAFEAKAEILVDHLLRGSMALHLSAALEPLVGDAGRVAGTRHSIFGAMPGAGVLALNPGEARGYLRVVDTEAGLQGTVDPRDIYVIPQTVSDLKPMAGILTLDSGNALSHTQLLAANLGIPNASVPSSLLPVLRKHAGEEVLYSVTPRGAVQLRRWSELPEQERREQSGHTDQATGRIALDMGRLNLGETRLLSLREVRGELSGVVAGPKAANLGELARRFPDKVAPGLIIPFGVYYRHIRRILPGETEPLDQQITTAYRRAEDMRAAGEPPERIAAFIYPQLERFRKQIQTMDLLPSFEQELRGAMEREFGRGGTHGVFVRSDTNAEDLPQFTGAGLNLSVPNVVGVSDVLQSIKDVWASPFTERAYDWRARAITNSENVYPSVLLLRSVASDKSGVIATTDLETGDLRSITVNASEGVSAVVDGGVAESLLLLPDGSTRLLQQARTTYRKALRREGGFLNLPSQADEELLRPEEIRQIREAVAEVRAKYPPVLDPGGQPLPWDIEFGFEQGQLRLFQIRPLVRASGTAAGADTRPETPSGPQRLVRLDDRI